MKTDYNDADTDHNDVKADYNDAATDYNDVRADHNDADTDYKDADTGDLKARTNATQRHWLCTPLLFLALLMQNSTRTLRSEMSRV